MKRWRSAGVLGFLLTCVPPIHAQSFEATLSGSVTDPSGAPVADARVSIVNLDTGVGHETVSSDRGVYAISGLPAGRYRFAAERAALARFERAELLLTTGATLTLNVPLRLPGIEESLHVSADVAGLRTRAPGFGHLVSSRMLEAVPLADRRPSNSFRVLAGVVFVNDYRVGTGRPDFSLTGGRTETQVFWIDGGAVQDMRLGTGHVDIEPPLETLQEIKVLSTNYPAEYGGGSGGVVLATLKSGQNRLHGSLSEDHRNSALDSRDFFTRSRSGAKPPLRYDVFGATLSGPIRRDHAFFFVGIETGPIEWGSAFAATVPSLAQRAGDFSETVDQNGKLQVIYDPETGLPFPGNRVPAERWDPAAARMLQYWPLPNQPAGNLAGAGNFAGITQQQVDRLNLTVKLDYTVSKRDRLQLRYVRNTDDRQTSGPFQDLIGGPDAISNTQQYLLLSHSHTFGSGFVHEARYSYGTRFYEAAAAGADEPWPSRLGLTGSVGNGFPKLDVPGFTIPGLGAEPLASLDRRQSPIRQHQFLETLSHLRGRHFLKAGFEARLSRSAESVVDWQPSLTFSSLTTASKPGDRATGSSLASFLLGLPTGVRSRATEPLDRSSWYLAAFVQDEWTLSPRLSLALGLRWEVDTPIMDARGRMNGFDPLAINPVSGTPGVVRFAGVDDWPEAPYQTDWNNFGPRLGFSWAAGQRTVLTGGLAVCYAHPFDRSVANSAALGFERSLSLVSPDGGFTPALALRDGIPSPATPALVSGFGAVAPGQRPTTSVEFFDPTRTSGYATQLHLGVEHRLLPALALTASYVGSFQRKLAAGPLSLDQTPPELMGPAARQSDRPYPQFSDVSMLAPSLGVSDYHGAIVQLAYDSRAVRAQASYTLSRLLSNTDDGSGGALGSKFQYADVYHRELDYGPAGNDIRHRLAGTLVFDVPIGPGRRILSRHWLGHLLGGWTLSAAGVFQSGPPLTITMATNGANAFAPSQRPDLLRDPTLPAAQRSPERWFDTSAFQAPASGTFGTAGRGVVRGPAYRSVDLSATKTVRFARGWRLQFRCDAFNALNWTNFGLPNTAMGDAAFGMISTTRPARTVQLGVRAEF